ncbi:META domain-containing protein [Niabella sp. CC-SYL272]|uniref:META domain-containing protein n=1 Tax=Niabella agricola TaxID=2891571 RepID=UPI001F27F258|nr:META domain-containing protein [Niabella agricola]MCF3107210.1 META domain-containing protein [Niabella agricola]
MRKMIFMLVALGTLFFAACNTSKQPKSGNAGGTTAILGQKWKLTELAGKPVPDQINQKEPFLQLQGSDSRFTASGGCNGLGGTFSLQDNNRIRFKPGPSTLMACEHMEIEQGLIKALESADNYTIHGSELSLNKARMAPLARFRAVSAETGGSALNGTWELNYISGSRIAFEGLYPRIRPTIVFNLPQTTANGNSSCNRYNISFTIDDHSIRFKEPASTKMFCEGTGEATFFNTLKTVNRYDIVGNSLHLIMGDIAVMRFERK